MRSIIVLLICFFSLQIRSQILETRYAIQTTFDDKKPVAYESNYGSLRINSSSGDLIFSTDLAALKTGNNKTDSLLVETGKIPFTFFGNLSQGLFGIINEENDDNYHKVLGTITINQSVYPAEAYVRINNLSDKSDISKALLDFRLQIDPRSVSIPILSDYFKNALLFLVIDGVINQNK